MYGYGKSEGMGGDCFQVNKPSYKTVTSEYLQIEGSRKLIVVNDVCLISSDESLNAQRVKRKISSEER